MSELYSGLGRLGHASLELRRVMMSWGAGSEDVINLAGFGSAFDSFAKVIATASDDGLHTTIDLGNGDMLVLRKVLVANLHEDDFTFG